MAIPQLVKLSKGNLLGRLSINYDKGNEILRGGLSIVDVRTGKVIGSREMEVPIGKIRELIMEMHRSKTPAAADELAGDTFALAGFWSDVKRKANKIAKKVGTKKLLRVAQKVMNDPRFSQGLAAASMIYPPLGMTVAQIQKANTLVLKASAGDSKAIAQVAAIADAAKKGNTAAAKVSAGMIALKQAHDQGKDPMGAVGAFITRRERIAPAMQLSHEPSPLRRLYLAAVNR